MHVTRLRYAYFHDPIVGLEREKQGGYDARLVTTLLRRKPLVDIRHERPHVLPLVQKSDEFESEVYLSRVEAGDRQILLEGINVADDGRQRAEFAVKQCVSRLVFDEDFVWKANQGPKSFVGL